MENTVKPKSKLKLSRLLIVLFIIVLLSVIALLIGIINTIKNPTNNPSLDNDGKMTVEVWSPRGTNIPTTTKVIASDTLLANNNNIFENINENQTSAAMEAQRNLDNIANKSNKAGNEVKKDALTSNQEVVEKPENAPQVQASQEKKNPPIAKKTPEVTQNAKVNNDLNKSSKVKKPAPAKELTDNLF